MFNFECSGGLSLFRAIAIGKLSVKSVFKIAVLKLQVNTWSFYDVINSRCWILSFPCWLSIVDIKLR